MTLAVGLVRGDGVVIVLAVVVILVGAVAHVPKKVGLAGASIEWPEVYKETVRKVEKSFTADAELAEPVLELEILAKEPRHIESMEDYAEAVADVIRVVAAARMREDWEPKDEGSHGN